MGFKMEWLQQSKSSSRKLVGEVFHRIRSKRAHKNKMTSSETVVKIYSQDDNGCSHDEPHQWTKERDIHYWGEEWMAATTNSQLLILAVVTPATTMATWRKQREMV